MVKDGVQNGRCRSANDSMRSRIRGIRSGIGNLWQPIWIGDGFGVVICVGSPDRGNWPPEVVDVFGVVEGYYPVGQGKVDQGKQPRALCGSQPIRQHGGLGNLVPIVLNSSIPESAGQRLVSRCDSAVDNSQCLHFVESVAIGIAIQSRWRPWTK